MEFAHIVQKIVIYAPPLLIAIILHEVSHGFVAYKLGDDTAKVMGRLTLNPVSHIDPFGTILMPILLYVSTNGQIVLGSAKPVPINPYNFKNPKRDMAISAAGGPVCNILLAIISVVLLKYVVAPAESSSSSEVASRVLYPLILMLKASAQFNVVLAVFNMIPLPPLDGGRVLMGFLPHKQADTLGKIEPYGFIIIILLVITGIAGYIIWPIISIIFSLLDLI